MADPSGSGAAQPDSGASTPRAIASLAKKQSDVTRLGSQKLKFVPTIPSRRKKEDVKPPEEPPSSHSPSTRGQRGGDRGRGLPRGRGGRGGDTRSSQSTRPPPQEMTASGPFAMGPTLAGSSSFSSASRRAAPRSNFTPLAPMGFGGAKSLGKGLTGSVGPSIGMKKEEGGEKGKGKEGGEDGDEDGEVYSDPDEGIEIVDMEDVRGMDWMAPESLKKERKKGAKKKLGEAKDAKLKGVAKPESMAVDDNEGGTPEEVNAANAVHLSESEEEEELEDIANDFAFHPDDLTADAFVRQERLYFFQFPNPFPIFHSKNPAPTTPELKGETSSSSQPTAENPSKKVSFAEDTKPPATAGPSSTPQPSTSSQNKKEKAGDGHLKTEEEEPKSDPKVDGIIGQLEVYRSGAVKMRLGNGIVYDVVAATQPSFLQHAVYLDTESKRLCVLGEVNRRFVVSPDIGVLLDAMDADGGRGAVDGLDDEGLIRMDVT